MRVKIETSWQKLLQTEFDQSYFEKLADFIKSEYQIKKVFPPPKNIFAAFEHCPFPQIKVVILGQDPYHGLGQAHGLCFSVPDRVSPPPSLQNIFKEIHSDLNKSIPDSGNLERWAKQGVFLLNTTLTVLAHQAGSHQKKGWETFTDHVIKIISDHKDHVVFLLWGAYAGQKENLINGKKHLILKAPHPSPFSVHRGFFGCKHFSRTNNYLKNHHLQPIDW